jgi:hypothetical protein
MTALRTKHEPSADQIPLAVINELNAAGVSQLGKIVYIALISVRPGQIDRLPETAEEKAAAIDELVTAGFVTRDREAEVEGQ